MTPEAILLAIAKVIEVYGNAATAIGEQMTSEQRKLAWDRYFEATAVFHGPFVRLAKKIEKELTD